MSNIILYQTSEGKVRIDVRFENETFWLSQKAMAELFHCSTDNVSLHLKNIFNEGELYENATTEDFSVVQTEGAREVNRSTKFYNLDAIIAVGYRVNSKQATQFRIWATQTLKEYIIKGFVMDDERLKQGKQFGKDYFDELLARIRDIRASEKRFYQKIKDLFTLSKDYTDNKQQTDLFFAQIQNKLLFAITEHTAAEIIASRANAELHNMGLTSWKGDRVRKEDIIIAKNYLNKAEIDKLNRMVTLFLDAAEIRVEDQTDLTLQFWQTEADAIIAFSRKKILSGTGTISQQDARELVGKQYAIFDSQRKQTEALQADEDDLKELEALAKSYKK